MILPYQLDVPMQRWPLANWLLIGVTIIVSVAMFGPLADWEATAREVHAAQLALGLHYTSPPAEGVLNYFLLQPAHFHPAQLLGHLFLHDGIGHLVGNMIFLWLFGNALNAKLGHWQFLLFYLSIGVLEGLLSLLFQSHLPSLGASGAIMGVCGAFLILYPLNDISIFYWLFSLYPRTMTLSTGWVLAAYFALDIWGALAGNDGGVGHSAHIAGFITGALAISFFLKKKWVETDENERTLLQVWNLMPEALPPQRVIIPPPVTRPRPVARPRETGPIPLD